MIMTAMALDVKVILFGLQKAILQFLHNLLTMTEMIAITTLELLENDLIAGKLSTLTISLL